MDKIDSLTKTLGFTFVCMYIVKKKWSSVFDVKGLSTEIAYYIELQEFTEIYILLM